MKDCEIDGYEKINSMSIDELELSVRSYSCLKRAGITTVGELRSKSSEDMMKVRNMSRKSLEEIIAQMRELGIDDFLPSNGWRYHIWWRRAFIAGTEDKSWASKKNKKPDPSSNTCMINGCTMYRSRGYDYCLTWLNIVVKERLS